jgi:hypothetical protein
VRDTLREHGEPIAAGAMTFMQARTANEVLKAQERRLRLQQMKAELVDRAKAVAQVFKLAREERDAWVNWPARVAAMMAAETLPGRRAVLSGVHASPGIAERRKKRIRALCRWHFQPGGGPEYRRACHDDGLPRARGEPGADGRLCPYREHALISRQEHDAWEVLVACQSQLRLAPSGYMMGIDLNAALRLATALGYDVAVLSELLPAAEAGLVEALSIDRGRDAGP